MTIALILITIALGLWLLRQWSRGDLAPPARTSRPTPRPTPRPAALPLHAASVSNPPSNRRAA